MKTIDAVYEHGTIRLQQKLPLREHARLTVTLTRAPTNPVRRTRGIIRVHPHTARALIAADEADFYGA